MKIILVMLGNFQEYILHNIKQLMLMGNTHIDIITDTCFFKHFEHLPVQLIDSTTLDDLKFNTSLDKNFRNGFWNFSSLRFFLIYSYMKKYNIEKCVHIENDVMVYENLDKLVFKKFIYTTFDSPRRVVPGFVYIPDYKSLEPILNNYNSMLNDMMNFAKHDFIQPLPIFPKFDSENETKYNKLYEQFHRIFDAAAMGQYLGGIDPRNRPGDTRGYVNETCFYKYDKYKFKWRKENGIYVPFLIVNNQWVKIVNLHIHSKHLQDFLSDKPVESKYIEFEM